MKYLLFATDGDSITAKLLLETPPELKSEVIVEGRSLNDCYRAIEQLITLAQTK